MKRWTIEELDKLSDIAVLRALVNDRLLGLKQYMPLARRLQTVDANLANLEKVYTGYQNLSTSVKTLFDKAVDVIKKADKKP